VRVAINGFGRIGRVFLRAVADREASVEVVAVTDVGDPAMMGTLLRHDSVFGPYPEAVAVSELALPQASAGHSSRVPAARWRAHSARSFIDVMVRSPWPRAIGARTD